MGSLSSRPKVPSQSPIVYYTPTPASSGQTDTPSDPETDPSEARKNNLLQRGRGRFSTIQTSFRGLLSLADSSSGRKTLLGE